MNGSTTLSVAPTAAAACTALPPGQRFVSGHRRERVRRGDGAAGTHDRGSAGVAMWRHVDLPQPGALWVWSPGIPGRCAGELRIEQVAQPVTEQVEAEDRHHDRGAGIEHEPRRLLEIEPAVGQDVCPTTARRAARPPRRNESAASVSTAAAKTKLPARSPATGNSATRVARMSVASPAPSDAPPPRTPSPITRTEPGRRGNARRVHDAMARMTLTTLGQRRHQRDRQDDRGERHEPVHHSHHRVVEPP